MRAPTAPRRDGHTDGGAPSGNAILIGHYGSMTGSEATFRTVDVERGPSRAQGSSTTRAGSAAGRSRLKEYDTQGKTEEAGTAVTRGCARTTR